MTTPSLSCSSYTYDVIAENGTLIINDGSLSLLNNSVYYFTFNEVEGDYVIDLCDNSVRAISVSKSSEEKARMYIAAVVGIGVICAILMWFSFRLEQDHGLLKILLQLTSISMLPIIPAVLVITNYDTIFYKAVMLFLIIFWTYVAGYVMYYYYKKLTEVVT